MSSPTHTMHGHSHAFQRPGQFFRVHRIARSPPMGGASLMAVATMETTRRAGFAPKCR
jgi:hypothetical protein